MGNKRSPAKKIVKAIKKAVKAAKKVPQSRKKPAPVKSPLVVNGLTFGHPNFALHHPDIKAEMLAAEDTAANPATDAERPIRFDVAGTSSYEHLRVTLDYVETVIYDDTNVPSQPRPNGRLISVLIEVMGSPGDKATISVTNAVPQQLVCEVSAGAASNACTRTLRASW